MHINQQIAFAFSLALSAFITFFASTTFAAKADASLVISDHSETLGESKLEKVTLQLKWLHQFQFAGYYAAHLKGFYQDEGLDVTIKQRDRYQNNIKQVIDGDAEYGVADSVLLLYQARNEPIVMIAPILQHSPQAIITLKSSGIDTPYKLNNRTLSFYNDDTDGFPLLAMFEQLGVQPTLDRRVKKTGPESLMRGEVDAYPGYLSNEPYLLEKAGYELNVFRPMNYGIDLYGDILFTNQTEALQNPERVERFKRATIKGWYYALNNKEELAQYIQTTLGSKKPLEHLLHEADVIEEIMAANTVPIGTLDVGRLQFIHNLFQKHGLIQKKLTFQEGIFRPKNTTLTYTEKERAWMKQNPTVRVAVDRAWGPIEFVTHSGKFSGITSGYLDYLSSKTGITFVPAKELSWTESVEQMQSGQLDMFSAVTNTPERRKYVDYTDPYLLFPTVIATQKGELFIDSMKRLNYKPVAVAEDYAFHENLRNQYPKIKIVLVKTPKEGLESVSKGKAYAYIDNIAVISYLIQKHNFSNLQINGESTLRADISMAVRKDWPELTSIIQKTLKGMDEATKNQLTDEWLKVTYKKEFEWQTLVLILLPISLALLAFLIYNRRLKILNGGLIEAQNELHDANKVLEQLSVTDHLTKAYNRGFLDKVTANEAQRADRYDSTVSFILFDLDDFKKVNDTYGHLVGDEVLIKCVEWIQRTIRQTDTFGRWGGEEFVLICPNTNLEDAFKIADKIRIGVSNLAISSKHRQTISAGVACYKPKEGVSPWISRADKALYRAKEQGKNQVVCAN